MKAILVRLPDDIVEALKRLKEQTDVPTNRLITRLIRQEIESLRELKYEEKDAISAYNFGRGIISDKPLLKNDPRACTKAELKSVEKQVAVLLAQPKVEKQ